MSDILGEYARGETLKQADINRFIDQGIPPMYLVRTWCGDYSYISRDAVVFQGDGFEFARYAPKTEQSAVAFTFVAFDRYGRPADLVAWRPPDLALWKGRVFALGEEQIDAPTFGEPLHVHGTVLDWLRAGRQGLFVLNHAIAAWELRTAGTLGVETETAAAELRTMLTVPPPPIVVSPFVSIEADDASVLDSCAA